MSASSSFSASGDICGSFRRPSRYLMSCQCVKNTGCPAREGVPAIVALPSGPWQAAQTWALRRPASRSAPGAAADRQQQGDGRDAHREPGGRQGW